MATLTHKPTSTASSGKSRWLFGPIPDLLFGCGLLYLGMFAVFALFGEQIRASQPQFLFPLMVILFSMPHYGGTLLRVYEQRADRRQYVIFSVYMTIAIAAWFVVSLYNQLSALWMVAIYLTWSPWHYTGQNYGLAVMFLRRSGAEYPAGAKRLLYGSFIFSYLLTFLVMHEATAGGETLLSYAGDQVLFLSLGIPTWVTSVFVPGVGLIYAVCLIGFIGVMSRRGATLGQLYPTLLLALTQALWFVFPHLVKHFGVQVGLEPMNYELRSHYFMWIALGHSTQYLWVTTYFARANKEAWTGYMPYLTKTLLAGTAIWLLPVLAFAPDGLGQLTYGTGLALLVASVVNIHHFMLDGAIWKLRSGRIANVLIRSRGDAEAEAQAGEWPTVRGMVWGACAALAICTFFVFWQVEFGYRKAVERGDLVTASVALDRLAWFGRDDPAARNALGDQFAKRGDWASAAAHFERSATLLPNLGAFNGLAYVQERQGDLTGAIESYERTYELAEGRRDVVLLVAQAMDRLRRPERANELRAIADRMNSTSTVEEQRSLDTSDLVGF